jgi:hypothetical protein
VVGGHVVLNNATLDLTSTNAALTYFAVPSGRYVEQRSTNLSTGAGWVAITVTNAPTNGVFRAVDSYEDLGGKPPSAAFYRLLQS